LPSKMDTLRTTQASCQKYPWSMARSQEEFRKKLNVLPWT
jgi:hypothetical protein